MMITISGRNAHATEPFSQTIEPRTHPSILLVNHDDALQDLLSAHGFEVRAASEGINVFEALRRSVPDAIIVDIDSPRPSGTALAEELTEWGLPLILMTSSPDRPVIAGADYVEKPIDVSDFVALLKRAIQRGKAQSSRPPHRRRVISP